MLKRLRLCRLLLVNLLEMLYLDCQSYPAGNESISLGTLFSFQLLFSTPFPSEAQTPAFTRISPNEGENGLLIGGITQDRQGLIRYATQAGLHPYDGTSPLPSGTIPPSPPVRVPDWDSP